MIAGLRLLEAAVLLTFPPDSAWCCRYGGAGEEWCFSTAESSSHEYVAVGHTTSYGEGDRDIWMVAVDEDGDSLWSKTFGGLDEDGIQQIINTSDGGYLLAGFTKSFGAEERDALLIKTDARGNTQWMQHYGGKSRDVSNCVLELPEGGYVFCGRTLSYSNSMDGLLMRVDEDGDSLWAKIYGGDKYDDFFYISAYKDGFILSGTTLSFGGGPYNGWLMKTNFEGDSLWSRSFGGPGEDVLRATQILPNDDILAAGFTDNLGDGSLDFWLLRCSSSGEPLWSKAYGGPGRDRAYWISETPDSCFAMVGDTYSYGAGKSDAWLLKVNTSGDSLWSKAYGGELEDECFSFLKTTDGCYLLSGRTECSSAGDTDFLLIKTSPDTSSTYLLPFPALHQEPIVSGSD